jgi:hypothetical protein
MVLVTYFVGVSVLLLTILQILEAAVARDPGLA